MQRPLKKWLESIAVKICILVLSAYPSFVWADNDIDKSRSKAQDAAGSVYEYLGSGAAIKQNAAEPITSSTTPMKTIDQSQSFSAQLSCPSTAKFVNILVQPGSTGDLARVMVMQDTNLDGQMDYQYNMPFPISGICGNGVIQCDLGTWNNCQYWKWVANTEGQLNIQQTDITKMGGCYCVNNSCGNNIAWVSLPLILKDLGAGATGAIMSQNPKYSITDVAISDAEISYYSQALTSCGAGNQGVANPANYFAGGMTDALVISAAQQEITAQQTEPDSLYSVMSNAIQYHDTMGNRVNCTIKRKINVVQASSCNYGNSPTVSGTICIDNQSSCVSYCDENNNIGCVYTLAPLPIYGGYIYQTGIRAVSASGNTINWADWGDGYYAGTLAIIPGHNVSGGFINCGYPGCVDRFRGEGNNVIFENCRISRWGCLRGYQEYCELYGPVDYTWQEVGRVEIEDAIVKTITPQNWFYLSQLGGSVWNSGNAVLYGPANDPGGIAFYTAQCQYPAAITDEVQESIDDQCFALDQKSNCKVEGEKVDNVYTVKNYVSTGLMPLATCKDLIGHYDHNICRDWWEKDRTYICQSDSKFDFRDSMRRVNSVYKTTRETNGAATFIDYRRDDKTKTWQTDGNTFDLGLARAQPYDTCSKVCKTRKPKLDTQATQSGITAQYRKDVTTYEFYYRQCYPSANICPAGHGEEILKDCQCIDEFAETFTLLESLKEAGYDALCSSGVKK
jgi:hypothetical protein